MRLKQTIVGDIVETYQKLSKEEKRNVWIMSVAYFFVLFIYPFFRASTTALYMQTYGAKATPVVEFLSIFVLIATIGIFNQLQKHWSVQTVFSFTNYLSAVIFVGFYGLFLLGVKEVTYFLYIWKEIYIILLIHQYWGYANNCFNYEQAKIFFGPVSAWGSFGGIVGGFLTASLIDQVSITGTIAIAVGLLIVNEYLFRKTKTLAKEQSYCENKNENKPSPIKALGNAKEYVFYIFVIVALSQFFINIANLQFNLLLEKNALLVDDKAKALANLYAYINIITLTFKLFVMPFLLLKMSNRSIQLTLPVLYLIVNFMGLGMGADMFIVVSGSFVFLKAMDYSCFAIAKEMLYYPLQTMQKYGAKYLVDVFAYRASKGVISLFLIYFQNITILTMINYGILLVWFLAIFALFRSQKRLEKCEQEVF